MVFNFRSKPAPLSINSRLAFLICLVLFITTACSSSKQNDTKIRLGYLQSDLHHLPAFVALEKGFFRDENLLVEVAGVFRAGPELMSAFAAKELDIGYVGLAPVITALANGTVQVKIIAQVNIEGSALVVGKDTPYTSLKDLRGKVITIPGHATVQDFLLRKALKQEGLSIDAVRLMVLKPPEMIPALSEGDIDAFIAWEPYPSKAITKNSGRILLSSHQIWENHPCCVVVADEGYLKTRPAVIEKVKMIHQRACEFISKNQSEAIDIGIKYTGMDRETVQMAITNIRYGGLPDRLKVSEYIAFLRELRYIKPDTSEKFLMSLFN